MFELTRRNSNHPINTYNPFRELEEFERNFFRQMDEMERRFFGPAFDDFFRSQELVAFKTDVTDEGDHYLLEADLPGFDKKDIQLDVNGDTMTVHAERRSKVEEKDKKDKIIHIERSYGAYSRSFNISGVDADGIKAKYDNGVLKLTLPKKQGVSPAGRHLEIE